ncbi:hypothetical protein [Saccharolobus islandicus]|uniref:hypothetical protein n=1 Tax=Saccharolobus islandicus TaxID=43080 RepID=UPI0003636801|nr:hypothetical protein [Sulfolobus islandicus]
MQSSKSEFIEKIYDFIKTNINLITNKRILLLNVNSQIVGILDLLGHVNAKIVALGKGDGIYDLPYYWRIKYINASLNQVRFPNSLFDRIFIFINNPIDSSEYLLPDELSRILKPKSPIYLLFLNEQTLFSKDKYLNILKEKFELFLDEKAIVNLKNIKNENIRNINTIYIYHPNLPKDGITEYAKHLIYRLKKEDLM